MKLTLFRGISLINDTELENTITEIRTNGLNINSLGSWEFPTNIKTNLNDLYLKKNINKSDTRFADNFKGFFFADLLGAQYYATRNQSRPTSIIISIEVDIKYVFIDGRDYLYNTFYKFKNGQNSQTSTNIINDLKTIYGKTIDKYICKFLEETKSDSDAICDLIIHDEEIILNHYKNNKIIGGRHGTMFRSSFYVQSPIKPEMIKSIEPIIYKLGGNLIADINFY